MGPLALRMNYVVLLGFKIILKEQRNPNKNVSWSRLVSVLSKRIHPPPLSAKPTKDPLDPKNASRFPVFKSGPPVCCPRSMKAGCLP